jgi:hypothetical protein
MNLNNTNQAIRNNLKRQCDNITCGIYNSYKTMPTLYSATQNFHITCFSECQPKILYLAFLIYSFFRQFFHSSGSFWNLAS